MKRKFEASKGLKTVTSVKSCLKLREKLKSAEDELKKMFLEKQLKNENVARAKIKRNPKVFFSMAKKKENILLMKVRQKPYRELIIKLSVSLMKMKKIQKPKEFFTNTDQNNMKIENIPLTTDYIKETIDVLSATLSPGTDGVPALMMKNAGTR